MQGTLVNLCYTMENHAIATMMTYFGSTDHGLGTEVDRWRGGTSSKNWLESPLIYIYIYIYIYINLFHLWALCSLVNIRICNKYPSTYSHQSTFYLSIKQIYSNLSIYRSIDRWQYLKPYIKRPSYSKSAKLFTKKKESNRRKFPKYPLTFVEIKGLRSPERVSDYQGRKVLIQRDLPELIATAFCLKCPKR